MWSHTARGRRAPTRTRTALLVLPGILLACALIFPLAASAQYRFDTWTTDSGVPQNTVFAILQTQEGYLWFTTSDGLVRYDGVTFTIFDKGNRKGIGSNRFTALYEDADRTLWIGTEDGYVSSYRQGVFVTYAAAPGFRANTVNCIQRDKQGTLWISMSGGISKFENGEFTRYVPEGIHADNVKAFPGPSGALWCFLNGEVRRLHNGTVTAYAFAGGFEPTLITAAYEDHEGGLWLGLAQGQLIRLKDGAVTKCRLGIDLAMRPIKAIYEDRRGVIWLGTEGHGLGISTLVLHAGSVPDSGKNLGTHASSVQNLSATENFNWLTTADGLPDNITLAVYEDREGTIWLGTATHGLSRMTRKAITVYSAKDGLSGDGTRAMFQDRAGDIWIGARVLDRLHDGRFTSYSNKDGLQFYSVTSLAEDREGRLWVGGAGGLSWYRDGKFINFSDKLGLKVGDYNVWAIHQDRSGALCDGGLCR